MAEVTDSISTGKSNAFRAILFGGLLAGFWGLARGGRVSSLAEAVVATSQVLAPVRHRLDNVHFEPTTTADLEE